jgi:hypothetical protein
LVYNTPNTLVRLTITTLSDKFGVEAGKAEQASPERLGLVEVK